MIAYMAASRSYLCSVFLVSKQKNKLNNKSVKHHTTKNVLQGLFVCLFCCFILPMYTEKMGCQWTKGIAQLWETLMNFNTGINNRNSPG